MQNQAVDVTWSPTIFSPGTSMSKGKLKTAAPLILGLAMAAACATPTRIPPDAPDGASASAPADALLPGDTIDTAVVRIREYPRSTAVTVVAWGTGDPRYGLRAMLRRDGTLIRDHRFYISTGWAPVTGTAGILVAPRDYIQTVAPSGHALRYTGIIRDPQPCQGGEGCSPYEAFSARVTDELLRASRDSLSVRLAAVGGTERTVTIPGDVIDAYLI